MRDFIPGLSVLAALMAAVTWLVVVSATSRDIAERRGVESFRTLCELHWCSEADAITYTYADRSWSCVCEGGE